MNNATISFKFFLFFNFRYNIFFMDPPPVLSSAFPLPPMGYIDLFSDDNIRQNNKILQPPPPIEVITNSFFFLNKSIQSIKII